MASPVPEFERKMVMKVAIFVAEKAEDFSAKFPSIVVQNT